MMAPTKTCRGCGLARPMGEFSPGAVRCKPCLASARRARRAEHPELDRANERRYRRANLAARQAARRAAYWQDPEPERIARRGYGQRPDVKLRHAQYEAFRRAMRAADPVFTRVQLAARLSMWPGCWMCGAPWTTIDHVKPRQAGGAHCLANLRPACRHCNCSKRGTWHGPRWAHSLAVDAT